MNHQVNEAEVRRIRGDAGDNLDIRHVKTRARLRADAVAVRAEQLEIAKHHITDAVPHRERAIHARLFSGHLPESNRRPRRAVNGGINVAYFMSAPAQPERVPRFAHLP